MSATTGYAYAYLHGFGSNRESHKGRYLRDELARDGVELALPDLNVPTFATQTYTRILEAVDALAASCGADARLRLIGSSMGGYIAARWAELHPERVDRLVLLCPGFDLVARWPLLVGDEEMQGWERDGALDVEDADGARQPLHWRFVEDSATHPAYPEVRCPTCILHGVRDVVVPVNLSRRYAAERPHVRLVELDDDHSLGASLERVAAEIRRHFEIDAR